MTIRTPRPAAITAREIVTDPATFAYPMPDDLTMTLSTTDIPGNQVTSAPFTTADLNRAAGGLNTARMKPGPEFAAARDNAYRVNAAELRQLIERFERLAAEKQDIADQQKEVMAEAKGRGYDTRALRKIIALRKRDPDDIAEEEAVLDLYREALDMT